MFRTRLSHFRCLRMKKPMSESKFAPAWIPKEVGGEEVSEGEARRRVAKHLEEAKKALDEDKQALIKQAKNEPAETKNDTL